MCAEKGTAVRAKTELCAQKKDFVSGVSRTVCAEDGFVCECGMIRVYQLKCDSLEMFSVNE